MPTHTLSSALIKLYYASPGAPWVYPTWQDVTGVRHGLFPADDDKLPYGWTRQMAGAIESYFDQYNQRKTEDEKIRFAAARKRAGEDEVAGRPLFRDWVTACYGIWNVHSIITQAFSEAHVHPIQIMSSNNDLTNFPSSNTYLPLVIDQIALLLFGSEALDKSGHLLLALRDSFLVLLQRTWQNCSRQTLRSKNRLVSNEKAAIDAFEALDRDTISKKKVTAVIRAVGRWKLLAELFCTETNLEKIEDMNEELQQLLAGIGGMTRRVNRGGSKKKTSYFKASVQSLAALATEEDVGDLFSLYNEYFGAESLDSMPLEMNENIGITFGEPIEGADPGVEVEFGMTYERLLKNLDFRKGLPFVFNARRHTSGYTAWDPNYASLFDPKITVESVEDLRLHWHQLAGVHAIIRMIFTPETAPSHCTGVLLADEVGLGKTFQACTVIGFLGELAVRQLKKLTLPPIIAMQPYLADYKELPLLPHLILVPGTLLSQWEHELKVAFKPKTFDILPYGLGEKQHEDFWAKDGPYFSSKHKEFNRIILASQSSLQQDFNLVYQSSRKSSGLPWDHPEPIPGASKNLERTLYNQRYLSVTFDEAQGVRNCGPKHSAALLILEQSVVRLILTATPLQTSTKDIAAMGRLVGIPYFSSQNALADQQADAAELRRAKAEKQELGTGEQEDPYRLCQVEASHRMQQQFMGRVIRRTVTSRDIHGKPLINLPPLDIVYGVVNLTDRETAIIDMQTEANLDAASAANGKLHTSSTFYLEHRKAVTFAREDPDEKIPIFKSIQEWELVKSTKIDLCARICQYILTRDDAPRILFENGVTIFPPMPTLQPGQVATRNTKVLIYQEFPSFSALLRNILRLYSVNSLCIDGRTPYEKRADIVQKFKTDPEQRVLIFSKVGSVGLNLSRASVLIFLDQAWSAQDERQIRGRLYRQPQNKEVTCFHLLANNTADITLSSMAQGKKDMLEAFLSSEMALKLKSLLSGSVLTESGSDLGDKDAIEDAEGKKKSKSKSRGKEKEKGKGKSKPKPKPLPPPLQLEEGTKTPSVPDVDDLSSTHETDYSSRPSSKPNTDDEGDSMQLDSLEKLSSQSIPPYDPSVNEELESFYDRMFDNGPVDQPPIDDPISSQATRKRPRPDSPKGIPTEKATSSKLSIKHPSQLARGLREIQLAAKDQALTSQAPPMKKLKSTGHMKPSTPVGEGPSSEPSVCAPPGSSPQASSPMASSGPSKSQPKPMKGVANGSEKIVVPIHRKPTAFDSLGLTALPPSKPPKRPNPFLSRKGGK